MEIGTKVIVRSKDSGVHFGTVEKIPDYGDDYPGQIERMAKHIHYPECWDTMAYPTLADAVCEITRCDPNQCTH